MKILYFHQHFSTPKGATGIRSYAMAQKLIGQGHEVTMVCGAYGVGKTGLDGDFIDGRREGKVDGIHVIEFDLAYSNHDSFIKRTWQFILFASKSIGVAMLAEYDLVFATSTPLTAGIPGMAARWLRRKKMVFEVRDLWPELPREMGVIKNPVILNAMSILEWASYKSAHKLVGLSPGIVEGIHKKGIESEDIAMIPNGCDLNIFDRPETPWRPEGVKADELMAVFAGAHGVANGLDAVLDAAELLKSQGEDKIKIVLIGDGREKAKLIERATTQKLDNVVFHDPVDKQKLTGLFASADIGLQILANVPAFYYGTSPNKFFDYISAGLPVLNNYPGWLSDLIKEHSCGYAVAPDDSTAFANALLDAAKNRKALLDMGKNARDLAKSSFDREKLSDQFVDWIESAHKPKRVTS